MTSEAGLRRVAELAAREHWLAVLVTVRPDGEPSTSVVNAGILPHPVTGEQMVALVSRGGTAKLRNLAARPRATLVFRAGWEWISVAGPAEVIGPEAGAEPLRLLLRDVYHAAGGVHPDLDEYDRVMLEDRRVAVLVRPERFATNP
ncbi:TIGR03618 family F420-dependent PPOX class oxidoreductase [Dactylosporangium aurantiacum]|uniref:TIGR03618 family F420-dependent PPOX class oxidoreductase n=1 Tax=Dactylosporangium aurantiacum TaxID=35754 RepID=A0A9Q9IQH6_9ACTN|nr:TIGR03618 family F420-dependent PPOX class oxidoreductase [Dactylosporangium aurantiacum]MDG6108033.1 TIGR03618 family F420-dependent PPOX class oxidoreductase [Dactylosporangium aurantiacum]UWZ59761.1 TIGR03618 family F420-dependent PPOX class oxidoreductase [Dactylosporangium aurantiacum]